MDYIVKNNSDELYRASVPFFLKNNSNEKIIYISSSVRNIDDYYFVIKDFYNHNSIKIETVNSSDEDIMGQKISLASIIKEEKFIIFTSINSAMEEYYENIEKIEIKKDTEFEMGKIIDFLSRSFYNKNYLVEKKGEYSNRGDILDIFLKDLDYPVRIEFFDNLIEDIRYFDPETQRSIEKIDKIEIFNIDENSTKKKLYEIIKEKNIKVYFENMELTDYKFEEFLLLDRENEEEFRNRYGNLKNVSENIKTKSFFNSEIDNFKNYDYLKDLAKTNKIKIYSEEEKRYKEIFKGLKNIKIENYPYFEGFKTEDELILTDRELKGIRVKRTEKRKEALKIKNINQILENDYIIHELYGVGLYLGTEAIDGRDYLKIKYADEDKLYVPVEHINRIEKYIVEPGQVPDVYKLGRRGFRRKKEKLRGEILEFARELIKVQALRNLNNAYAFSEDTVWQEEFEEGFPYTETKDQFKAINDVKNDMESLKSMDRIICGDVGYGKTEVALRATFKAVMDGKQVAILAPTTVLVHQHYERFLERFKNFPVEIESLSRLKTPKQQKEIIEKLKTGRIDILIGTHRIIQSDIEFKDLGLLIIDEEQKFGVKAKEKFKKYRNNIDILTLTATPIPRTLNMAMLGIREISIIATAPKNRQEIESKFIDKSNKEISNIILKELARDGQVFYIYNSVKTMEKKVEELEKMLPAYIKISYIHGQMESKEIKKRIEDFENGQYDLLISTTLIENGIDIENVNTMIIENFNKLGLAQIYQLRGRIGRSGKKAYCYLLYDGKDKDKKKKAKRDSIERIEGVGAGFQLSMEDMRMRGAGEILGDKQHGMIDSLGYDLYVKILNEQVKTLKGEEIKNYDEVNMDIKMKGYIPNDYIYPTEKLRIYKRIILIDDIEELDDIYIELEDRFGKMPKACEELFEFFHIKLLAYEKGIKEIKEKNGKYYIKFFNNKIEIDKVNMLILNEELKYIQHDESVMLEEKEKIITILEKI